MPAPVSSLYWNLPGPSGFIQRVQSRARACRATVLSFPRYLVPGTWEGVKEGLRCADVRNVVDLVIREGADVAYEIGPHVHRELVTAPQLAEVVSAEPLAVLLRAASDSARISCQEYFAKFLAALEHAAGNVHLFLEMRHGEWELDQFGRDVQVLAFDGSLSSDEIDAYVGIRMIGREGPGTTKLLRALVSEYAGFDVHLAERLIGFADDDILRLPESLGTLIEEDPLRWRVQDWAQGTSSVNSDKSWHPLHEWYLALHVGPWQQEARLAAHRRYWRACVRALTPWLEERRGSILSIFQGPLDDLIASAPNGKLTKTLRSGRTIEVDHTELDYNNLVGLVYNGGLKLPQDGVVQQAFAVCKVAKAVRDDLAHLRAPKSQDITTLVAAMDALLTERRRRTAKTLRSEAV